MGEERERQGASFDWDGSEDLTVLSVGELEGLLDKFVAEEREVSYRRRVLQGRIDLVRAEIVRRGGVFVEPEELARILLGDSEAADPEGRPEGNPEGNPEGDPEGDPEGRGVS
jgi:hypothetical protein